MAVSLTVVDAVTFALAAATVSLAVLAIVIGMLAFWGYRDIKAAATRAAKIEAQRVAEEVAIREIRTYLDKVGSGEDISSAYRDKP